MVIAICDNHALDRTLLSDMLHGFFAKKSIRYQLTHYENEKNLLCDVSEGIEFDVIFLEIYMGGMLGIDVARRLRRQRYSGEIVFLASCSDFAVDSYDVAAAGYLLKPHSLFALNKVMERIAQKFEVCTYQVHQRTTLLHIPYQEILYIESNNSKCTLYRSDGNSYIIYKRLSEIEQTLVAGQFLRCHQSYLVNMDYIQQVDKSFRLVTGDTVLIRQRDIKSIRQAYVDYLSTKVYLPKL